MKAQLASARWDLENTVIRAPADGLVTNVQALQPGARVVSMPMQQAMVFVDEMTPMPHGVRLVFEDPEVADRLTAGAIGTATIYITLTEEVVFNWRAG